ncbi:hypothetical protein LP420_36010 [Massilia sp. B-10]|nr:hypothetical protein LP420_36010 [Massilia sp. B-10]
MFRRRRRRAQERLRSRHRQQGAGHVRPAQPGQAERRRLHGLHVLNPATATRRRS